MKIEAITYEQARKEFFEKELVHKHAQLTYWLRKHDHWKWILPLPPKEEST